MEKPWAAAAAHDGARQRHYADGRPRRAPRERRQAGYLRLGGTGVTRQIQQRRIPVILQADELTNTRVGLIAIADAVYQSTGDRIGTTQRRPVRQGIHFGGVELARHRHTVPNLFRQALQQSSIGLRCASV